MKFSITATKDGAPVFEPCQIRYMIDSEAVGVGSNSCQVYTQINPDFTNGASVEMASVNFYSLIDLLGLPRLASPDGIYTMELNRILDACEDILSRLDARLLQCGFGVDLRRFWLSLVLQVRDVAVVGLSRGADSLVAR